MESIFYTLPIASAQIIEKLAEFAAEAYPNWQVKNFVADTNVGNFKFVETDKSLGSTISQSKEYAPKLKALIDHRYIETKRAYITSATPSGDSTVAFETEGGKGPQIRLTTTGNSTEEQVRLADILNSKFQLLKHAEILGTNVDPASLPIAKFSERIIQDFASEAVKLGKLSSENIDRLNKVLIEKVESLEKIYQEKESRLDSSFQEKEAALNDRIKGQQAKEAAFDLRENTVVRRAIFDDLLKIIDEQKEVKVSDQTLKKRRVIHSVCGVLGGLGAALLSVGAHKFLNATALDWHLLVPITGGLILTGSTAVFYLRWADQWFRDYAQAEFANRKFKADMSRAAWLVEMFFEWEQKKVTSVPHEIIERLSANLFSAEHHGGTRHPFDDLAGIAKEASKFKIGKTGIEFEREPKAS